MKIIFEVGNNMILAIIGSRQLQPNLEKYLAHFDIDEVVSGGARGVDTIAENFAKANKKKLTVFLPDYKAYGRPAPLIRNRLIVDRADEVAAFWDGKSTGTIYTIKYAQKMGKKVHLFVATADGFKMT